jgi:ribosomal protein S27AE
MSIEVEDQEPVVLLRSQFECPKCGDIIASIHRHDFQRCRCGATCLDGGFDYLRVAGDWTMAVDPDTVRQLSKPITIAGPHNKASKMYALAIYKALWAASARSLHPATTTDVFNALRARGEKATVKSMMVYLNLFVESDCVSRERGGHSYVWKPLVPLVERPDAP